MTGEIVTACCALCGADETEFSPVERGNVVVRMGGLYPLSRWRVNSKLRRRVEQQRGQNGNLLCGNCYFYLTDDE